MPDFFVELANEDIMELDDDTKEAFDTPSLPENFNKREVNLMIEKIDEESIFKATLISLQEINAHEEKALRIMQDKIIWYGESVYENMERETSAKLTNCAKPQQ